MKYTLNIPIRTRAYLAFQGFIVGTVFGAMLVLILLIATGHAHADPYCGAGSNFDARHPEVCSPGNPVPSPGYFPYPGPGQGPDNTGGFPNNRGGY
jgi:hypothetical protein